MIYQSNELNIGVGSEYRFTFNYDEIEYDTRDLQDTGFNYIIHNVEF